jgi:tape measure domain-containing protein
MAEPIDEAFVQITPDFNNFEQNVDRHVVGTLEELVPTVRELIDTMERLFEELTTTLSHEFTDLRSDITFDLERIAMASETMSDDMLSSVREGTNAAGRQFDQLAHTASADLAKVDRKADETGRGLAGGLGGFLAGGALFGGIVAAGAGLVQLTTFGLQSAASLEQTAIQFKALTGSAEAGQKVLSDLQKFAALTPFEFPDVAHAAARFLTFDDAIGISDNQLQSFLTTVGNVISVTGGGAQALNTVTLAMGQIASTGKLTLENLNQISESLPGFSGVAAIAAARGETTAQVMQEISRGEINAKDGIKALLEGMQQFPGAAGAMESQGQTLLGVFSTFKDTIGQSLAKAFEPVIPAIKDSLTQITPILGDALGKIAPLIGGLLSQLLPIAGQLVNALVPILTPLLNGLEPALATLGTALGPLGSALGQIVEAVAPLLPVLAGLISSLVEGLAPIIVALTPGIDALVGVIDSLAAVLGPILIQLGGQLAALIIPLIQRFADIMGVLGPAIVQILPVLAQLAGPALNALIQVLPQILDATSALIPAWMQLIPVIVQLLVSLMPLAQLFADLGLELAPLLIQLIKWATQMGVFELVGVAIPILTALVDVIKFLLKPIESLNHWLEQVKKTTGGLSFGKIADEIGGAFTKAWEVVSKFFMDLPGEILGWLAALPGLAADAFRAMFDAVFYAIGFGIGLIIGEFLALPGQLIAITKAIGDGVVAGFHWLIDQAKAIISWLWNDLPRLTREAFGRFVDFIKSAFDSAVTFTKELPGRIASGLSNLWTSIKTAVGDLGADALELGKNIIEGIIHGIENGAGALLNAAKEAAKKALQGAKDALKIGSPSKEFAKLGDFSMQGFAMGIDRSAGIAQSATSSALSDALGAGGSTINNASSSTGGIVFGPGAINVTLGAGATQQDAYAAGQQVAAGIVSGLGDSSYLGPRTVL